MGYDSPYVWAVLCKNHRFHHRSNTLFDHKIPLGETDAYSPPPTLDGRFDVRCDDCGEQYSYKPKELVRVELDLPASFMPHPLFS
jgi:hypothetical protein